MPKNKSTADKSKQKEKTKIKKEASTEQYADHKKQTQDDVTSTDARPSTAATSNQPLGDAAPNLKDMKPNKRKSVINSEFMNFMGSFVTKTSTKVLPGIVNQVRAEQERRNLLNKIKHGEDVEEFEPDVQDIAHYVQDQLQIGWKTVGTESQSKIK